MNINLKFWNRKKRVEEDLSTTADMANTIPEVKGVNDYIADNGMYGRLKHILTHDADGLGLPGKTPEEQAALMNAATWTQAYFGKPITIHPDHCREALKENN